MSAEYTVPSWESGVKQLAPNVYAYIQAKATWYWSNAGFIVGKDYVVVVDSLATVGLTQKFRDEIRKVTDKPIRYLINTHHHGDHLGDAAALARNSFSVAKSMPGTGMLAARRYNAKMPNVISNLRRISSDLHR